MKLLLASLIALTPVSASADDVIGWETTSKTCYRETYREEYVPGTKDNPGYVRTFSELLEVPCVKIIMLTLIPSLEEKL